MAVPGDDELLAVYVHPETSRWQREDAFRTLVERYQRRVYSICFRQLGRREDAEEATQDTFLSIARKAGQFRGASQVSTWIHRIAVNACHDLGRKAARRPAVPVEDIGRLADEHPATADDELAGQELATEIGGALLALDELSRTLVVLCALEGHTYAEVSAMLDLPVGTIKSRMFRARARLAELLAPVLAADEPTDQPPRPSRTRISGSGSRPRAPPGDHRGAQP